MWLSERAGARGFSGGARAAVGGVTIGGGAAAVLLAGECRDLSTAFPGGLSWRPAPGDQALVLETGDGERCLLGLLRDPGDLSEGELRLDTGRARVSLLPGGEIRIAGNVSITGDLLLNGRAVKTEEES